MIPSSIILAGVIIAMAVVYVQMPRVMVQPPDSGKVAAPLLGASALDALKIRQNDFTIGNPSAKVVVVEYGDFQCPFCGRFFETTETQLRETYIKQGKAVFVWRDFAFLGEESIRASEAARCAGEQGKFWEYHDKLFSSQNGENQGAFNDAKLKQFASALGLKTTAFASCFDSNKYRASVLKDTEEGKVVGVSGTPTTFVNGEIVHGAVVYDTFKNMIERELAK